MARCFYKLKDFDQSGAAFKVAMDCIEKAEIANETKTKLLTDIGKLMAQIKRKNLPVDTALKTGK